MESDLNESIALLVAITEVWFYVFLTAFMSAVVAMLTISSKQL
jgi:hypothetical protein